MADNQDIRVVGSSGGGGFFANMGQAILCSVCVAPVMIIGGSFLLGTNEKVAMCQTRAISAGESAVKEVGCSKSKDPLGNNDLVMFSCDLQNQDTLKLGPHWQNWDMAQGFLHNVDYRGTGLRMVVEMWQCKERRHSETREEDGVEKEIVTYTYEPVWSEQPIESGSFSKTGSNSFQHNCGVHNPYWPTGIPRSMRLDSPEVTLGEFKLSPHYVEKFPLDKPVELLHLQQGWVKGDETGEWVTSNFRAPGQTGSALTNAGTHWAHIRIGDIRVKLYGTDWSKPKFTALGFETAGEVKEWKAPGAWLCSGYHISKLEEGTVDKGALFEALQDESDSQLFLLRCLGFAILWCAFALVAAPLGVVADCMPFIGKYLGQMVDCMVCTVSCLPATACCMLVAGTVWIVMRPEVGVPMFLVAFGLIAGLAYAKSMRAKNGGEESKPLQESAE